MGDFAVKNGENLGYLPARRPSHVSVSVWLNNRALL
jgi:hypothetical protein